MITFYVNIKMLLNILFTVSIFIGSINGYANLDWEATNPAFDQRLYEDVLDSEQCREQLEYLRQNQLLALQFLDAGLRIPRGITAGNLLDWGNFFECININGNTGTTSVEGKYCSINVPANQSLHLPELPGLPDWLPEIPGLPERVISFDPRDLVVDEETSKKVKEYKRVQSAINALTGQSRTLQGTSFENVDFTLAVCIPKVCTTEEWMNSFLFNLTSVGFQYEENFCRLKNDKPWVPADYVAVVLFPLIGLITILCTSYDFWHVHHLKTDPKKINRLYRSFSVYTNYQRLTTFTTIPGAIECLDGIRAIAMIWVIIGHAFSTLPPRMNMIESLNWTLSFESTWITAAPISVDTFFMISGMLLVYTTAGKLTGNKLLKNLHFFYLNRLFRMFPLLAAGVLVQASFLQRLADGPNWDQVARNTNNCRTYWWSTLLHIQNFVNGDNMCLAHTWYLAIDVQLHILSPVILYWVLSGKKIIAWVALFTGLLSFQIGATIYNFIEDFPGAIIAIARNDEHMWYMVHYYVNTLTRASPFFVGMIFGYLLHLWRGKELVMSKMTTLLLWICAFILTTLAIYSAHPMKDTNWDNQLVDNLVNSFSRGIWAAGVGWMIFACHNGYGGPINWLLSHRMWKLISRISYAMYIFHFPIMFITAGTPISPIHFTVMSTVYRFFSEFSMTFVLSFAITLLIDSPFSIILKQLIGGGPKKQAVEKLNDKGFHNGDLKETIPTFKNGKYAVKL